MNQEKIGKFIAESRKAKKITQEQLAEKIGVSKNAVSKWERGINLPDASIMQELCKILDITLNELFNGEKIPENKYKDIAENNLMELKKQIDKRKKLATIFFYAFAVILVLMFIGNMVLNYIYGDNWDSEAYSKISTVFYMITCILWFITSTLNFKEGKKK